MVLRRTRGAWLVVAGLAAVMAAGCGRLPPPPFWEPTAADSAGIAACIESQTAMLRAGLMESSMQPADLAIPESVITKAIADNPFKQRFRCDSFRQVFDYQAAGYVLGRSFIATLDTLRDSVESGGVWRETTWVETTATVTVAETIPGTVVLHAFKYTRFVKDSVFETSPGETVRLKYYSPTFTDTSMYVEKPLLASVTGGCVLRKESGEWRLWKLSGGLRFTAPTPEDAPYLVSFQLASSGRTDTISLRPDTLHYGIQRFYLFEGERSQLLSFVPGDSARLPVITGYATDVMSFVHYKGVRKRWQPTTRIFFSEEGVERMFLQQIPFNVFYDIDGELVSIAWGVPLRVKSGGAR